MQTGLPDNLQQQPQRSYLRRIFVYCKDFVRKFNNDWTTHLAASLAYHLIIAIVPMFVTIISVFTLTIGRLDPASLQGLISGLQSLFSLPKSSVGFLEMATSSLVQNAGLISFISICAAIYGGARFFLTIDGCFNIIYRTRKRIYIVQYAWAILIVLVFIVLIPCIVFISAIPTLLFSFIQNLGLIDKLGLSQLTSNSLVVSLVSILGGTCIAWILFQVIYMCMPNRRVRLRKSWVGAVGAAIAVEAFMALFPFYIARYARSYTGLAGLAIILMLFFYYFAIILLTGAQINAYCFEHIQPLRKNLATVLHYATTAENAEKHPSQKMDLPAQK